MKKNKKIGILIGVIVGAVLVTAYFVLRGIFPEQVAHYTQVIWDKLNEPLPLVGVSTLMVLVFAWNVFKNSSLGKHQINEFKRIAQETRDDFEALKVKYEKEINECNQIIHEYREELNKYRELIGKVCETIPNKKVNQLGAEFNERKEAINNETKAD